MSAKSPQQEIDYAVSVCYKAMRLYEAHLQRGVKLTEDFDRFADLEMEVQHLLKRGPDTTNVWEWEEVERFMEMYFC